MNLENSLHAIAAEFSPAALASSLSAEDMVITDVIARARLPISIFALDTGRLHGDTLDLIEKTRTHYGIEVTLFTPHPSAVSEYVSTHGNPLAAWSEAEVWEYVREHRVPYNPLYDQGYRSIGCAPCTRPVVAGEDPRAGRWWWEIVEHRECGIHPQNRDRPRFSRLKSVA
jgi:phosphoadenosine phosphosulfate reductase